jgi:spermidine synthase
MIDAPRPSLQPRAGRVLAFAVALCLLLALGYWITSRRAPVVIFDAESEFGRVWVVERGDGLRSLYMGDGRARQSAVYPGRPEHLEIPYTRVAMVGLALTPPDGRILFVGLGGGAMPMYARQVMPHAMIEAVEIDPLIVEVAREYFGFRPDSRLAVHTGDGRAFIEQAPFGPYDLIVLDAFSDDFIPPSLTTRQFLEAVRAALAPDGVVVSNLWSSSAEYASMLATYDAVFGRMALIRVGGGVQRILIAGSDARALGLPDLVEAGRRLAGRVELGFDLPALVEQGYTSPPELRAPVLEDARSPPDTATPAEGQGSGGAEGKLLSDRPSAPPPLCHGSGTTASTIGEAGPPKRISTRALA